MRVRFELGGFVVGLLALVVVAACGGGSDEGTGTGRALLIVDADAREAGVQVRLPGSLVYSQSGLVLDGLPAAVEAPGRVTIVRPGGDEATIDVRADEVVHVRGADGRADVLMLGETVDPDRIVLHADEAAVVAIAHELDAEVERAPDGAWIVIARDALGLVATAEVRQRIGGELLQVREAFPVESAFAPDGGADAALAELLEDPTLAEGPETTFVEPPVEAVPDVSPVQGLAPAAQQQIAPAVDRPGEHQTMSGGPLASDVPAHGALIGMAATPAVSLGLTPRDLTTRPANVIGEGVACTDPVAGTWVGLIDDARYGDWYEFTLEIRHTPGAAGEAGALEGEVRARSWWGGPQMSEAPAACSPWGGTIFHWTVGMQGRGQYSGGKLRFGGVDWRVTATPCGDAPGPGMYNLDVFSGWVTDDHAYFASTNTDGGRMHEYPTPFRRVSCGR